MLNRRSHQISPCLLPPISYLNDWSWAESLGPAHPKHLLAGSRKMEEEKQHESRLTWPERPQVPNSGLLGAAREAGSLLASVYGNWET